MRILLPICIQFGWIPDIPNERISIVVILPCIYKYIYCIDVRRAIRRITGMRLIYIRVYNTQVYIVRDFSCYEKSVLFYIIVLNE